MTWAYSSDWPKQYRPIRYMDDSAYEVMPEWVGYMTQAALESYARRKGIEVWEAAVLFNAE
jgi:hypothetical protein